MKILLNACLTLLFYYNDTLKVNIKMINSFKK